MGKEVVFDYSKATGFISAEEMAKLQKNSYDSKGDFVKQRRCWKRLSWLDRSSS